MFTWKSHMPLITMNVDLYKILNLIEHYESIIIFYYTQLHSSGE